MVSRRRDMGISIKCNNNSYRKTRSRKFLQIIPYFFTFGNALCGFLAVLQALQGNFVIAAYCIALAAFMDGCDGRLARAFGASSCLGAELDMLCDAVSFCFSPMIVLYSFYNYPIDARFAMALAMYLCSGLFRLAKFNSIYRNSSLDVFNGLPTTAAAFFLSSIVVYHQWFEESALRCLVNQSGTSVLVVVLGLLMISSIPFPRVDTIFVSLKRYSVQSWVACMKILSALGFLMFFVSRGFPIIFVILSSYIVSSCLLYALSLTKYFLFSVKKTLE